MTTPTSKHKRAAKPKGFMIVEEIADLLGVTVPEVGFLVQRHVISRHENGYYEPKACVHGYIASLKEGEVTRPKAAELAGVSAALLTQIEKSGHLKLNERGRYTIVNTFRGLLAYEKDPERRKNKGNQKNDLADARQEEIRQRIAMRDGDLAPVDSVMAHVSTIAAEIAELLSGLPARVTRDLDQRRKIKNEVDAVRLQISERVKKAVADARAKCL